jgi:hypothetical protein
MNPRHREEVLNVILALLLHRRGIVAAPEQILRIHLEQGRAIPDVMVHYQGLRTAIEGRTVIGQAAQNALLKKTRERVQKGVAHLGIAIIYPTFLSKVPFEQLEQELARARLQFAVISEAEDVQLVFRLPNEPEPEDLAMPAVWVQGDLDNLSDMLRRTYERLVREDVVKRAADTIQAGIVELSEVILRSPGSVDRSAAALGIKATAIGDSGIPQEEE